MNDDPKTLLQRYQPKQVKVVTLDRQLLCLRYSPCGKVLAAGSQDATVRRWDATSDQFAALPPLTGHNGWVSTLAFHSDARRLFSADSWGRLSCWAYGDKDAKPLWSVAQAHDGWVRGVVISPDGKTLATCGNDGKVRLWSADDGKPIRDLTNHPKDVYAIAFHPDGRSLVLGDIGGALKQFETASGKCQRDLDASVLYRVDRLQDVGGLRCLAFDSAGSTLLVGGMKVANGGNPQGTPTLLVFDWATGKVKHTLSVGGTGDGYIYDLHVHSSGFVMAVTSGNPGSGKLFFARPADAQPFFITTAMPNCHAVAVHPNGQRLIVSATNGGSNGNGRQLKNGEYPGNFSPLHVWDLPKPA